VAYAGSGAAGGANCSNTITSYTATFLARQAATWVGNTANTTYTVSTNRTNALLNTTGQAYVSNVLSPTRSETETAFITAAATSAGAASYFSALTTTTWTSQNLANYIAYRWALSFGVADTESVYVNAGFVNTYGTVGAGSVWNLTLNTASSLAYSAATRTYTIPALYLSNPTTPQAASYASGIKTTGIISLGINAASPPAPSSAYAKLAATTFNMGVPGVSAAWTTTYTPTNSAATGTITLSGLGALVTGGTVTTGNITTTAAAQAANNTAIAAALQAALPTGSTVVASSSGGAGTSAVITFTVPGTFTQAGGASSGSFTFTNGGAKLPATLAIGFANNDLQANAVTAIRNACNGNATITSNWTVASTGSTVTLTEISGSTSANSVTISLSLTGGTTISPPSASLTTAGSSGATVYTMAFSIPAVSTAVTPVPAFTATNAIGTAFSNGTITSSTATTNGGANPFSLTGTNYLGLPTTGTWLQSSGAFVGGAFTIQMTSSLTAGAGTCLAMQNFAPQNNSQNMVFNGTQLGNIINVITPDANTYAVLLTNCSLGVIAIFVPTILNFGAVRSATNCGSFGSAIVLPPSWPGSSASRNCQ
jgi:hypothetical protein